ncbi:MAG TPA: T9SS type A sorting domain-containing protein [Chitinophagaceae bacterium]|nr:T9SS type A sorting domain-containing protein [Chitinophagaceae bacterium]
MKILYSTLSLLLSINAWSAAPTIASTNLWFNAIDGDYFNLGWTMGNGARRIMVCKAGSAPAFVPQNGIDYNANTQFGLGQEVAPGEFIVYDHFSSSFFLTGLTPATQYFFRVYEYNGTGTATEYLTSSFLSGSGTTSATPTLQTSNAVFTNISTNSLTVSWASGNGFRRLIVVREASVVGVDPVVGQPYNVSFQYGNGAVTGPGNYTVYNSTGTSTTVSNLSPGVQYIFSFYEFNGSGEPQYLMPAYTANVTTRTIPTIASSNLMITKTDGKELFLGWTNGNGQRRIVVAKQGTDVTSSPVNGIDYNANAVFGQGQQLGAGEYVVYDDNFNATSISGLNPATIYFFKVFEYDGTGSNTIYLTSSFAAVSGSTAVTPTVQAQALPVSNITSNSMRLELAAGNGRARLIIGRKNAAVNMNPADFTAYTSNTDFGAGQDLGNGNFVLAATNQSLVTIHALEPNAVYHFAIFEFNGYNQPLYLSPAITISATTSGVLPVKLLSFEASPAANRVKLQWKTATEENASHFIVERSTDAVNYTAVSTVNAIGNSQAEMNYAVDDNNPLTGKSYYRLKMVDMDGKFEYSVTRVVLFSEKATVRIAGNPARDQLQIIASTIGNVKNSWQIINPAGQVIRKGNLQAARTELNISELAAGQYWLRVELDDEVQILSFIKT